MKPLRICLVNAIAPPAAGSRAERWAFLVRELARNGHRITCVRAALPAAYPSVDPKLERVMNELPVEHVVIDAGPAARLQFGSPGTGAARTVRKALSEVAWPDYWSRFAIRAIRELAKRSGEFDLVVSSGQPWSDHLVGYELQRVSGIPWVADYGDPWGITLGQQGWRENTNFRVERSLLRLASGVVVTTPATADMFAQRYGVPRERLAVIPAGLQLDELPDPPDGHGLSMLHAGAVYGPRASIVPFLDAVAEFRRSRTDAVTLNWYGDLWRTGDRDAVERVADHVGGRVPYDVVRRAEIAANALVILGNHGGLQLPAKLWRAAGTGRMMLGVAADGDDALHAVSDLPGLTVVANRTADIVAALGRLAADATTWDSAAIRASRTEHGWSARRGALEACFERAVVADPSIAAIATGAVAGRSLIRRHTLMGHRLISRVGQVVRNAALVRKSRLART